MASFSLQAAVRLEMKRELFHFHASQEDQNMFKSISEIIQFLQTDFFTPLTFKKKKNRGKVKQHK